MRDYHAMHYLIWVNWVATTDNGVTTVILPYSGPLSSSVFTLQMPFILYSEQFNF